MGARRKIFLSVLAIFIISFFIPQLGYAAGRVNAVLSVSNYSPAPGEDVTITAKVIWSAPVGGNAVDIDCQISFGGAGGESKICTIPSGPANQSCAWSFTQSFSAPGQKLISLSCSYSTVDFDSELITVNVGGTPPSPCVPDGCNHICPPNCSVNEDPDCGCLDNDGCCGINCDYIRDNDCSSPPPVATGYDNPLLSQDISEFIWQTLRYFFQVLLYGIAPLLIIIGAYVMATSGGSASKIALGKKIVIWTLVGVAIILTARGMIALILMILGG